MEEQSKKRLITTRAVAKASLTRLAKFVNEFEAGSDVYAIQVRLRELPNIRNKFEEAQSQLELFEDVESHAADRDSFESAYFDIEASMTKLVAERSERNASDNLGSSLSHTSAEKRPIKLPVIKLPTFSGDVTTFKHFYDTFESLVVNNENLDDIQRFHYLLSCLTGEAHSLIASVPVTSSNFEVALKTVCGRYDNLRLIASAHLTRLLSLPTAHKSSASELRALINQTLSNLNAIKALHLEISLEDLIVSQLVLDKLDIVIRKEFEDTLEAKTFPSLQHLIAFLEARCKSLEIVSSKSENSGNSNVHKKKLTGQKHTSSLQQAYVVTNANCAYCKSAHTLAKCQDFARAPVLERREVVKNANLCFNCLKSDHLVKKCKSGNCRICAKKHHTLVHLDSCSQQHNVSSAKESHINSSTENSATNYCAFKIEPQRRILLSTALIKVQGDKGQWQICRALLDTGSQSCFISEDCTQRLRLQRHHDPRPVQGIGNTVSETKHGVCIQIGSLSSDLHMSVNCLVLPKVTESLPVETIDCSEWNLPENITYADPKFCEPGKIDVLLGAEVCSYIQRQGKLVRDYNHPVILETEFGWVISGCYADAKEARNIPRRPVVSCFATSETSIQYQLQKFWEIEELHQAPKTKDERECEFHFSQNTTRDCSGRFVVRLQFKEDPEVLDDSKIMATTRLYKTEQRLKRNPTMQKEYSKFLREYEELGHMELAEPTSSRCFYMPHHAVFKKDSSTTKVRVVFDCSAATKNGISLNDLLYVGPTIQQDIYSIILRFRTHAVAFTADIEKMYRQIWVHPDDRNYQRILWRSNSASAVQEYQLNTVTYGMASSPFLAVRCLQQLAHNEALSFPKASVIILRDFYVDDCISGCDTLDEALEVQQELTEVLQRGGFSLRKWSSNHAEFLTNIPSENRETHLPLQLYKDSVTTLGLLWHPTADKFQIKTELTSRSYAHRFTKRIVLSIISSIFDPLGFISPIVILCKMSLQRLWEQKSTWDQPLSPKMAADWNSLYEQLPFINSIQIDRRVIGHGSRSNIELHGFCDASERAYGGCIYVQSVNNEGMIITKLLCSKSRVAPLKKLSLPRLELCGALLLSRLLKKAREAINISLDHIYLWTDSTVVLSWLSAPSTRWKTFVANRVCEIQDISEGSLWRHVPSEDNPADLISRGVLPQNLVMDKMWWEGPGWLSEDATRWPALEDSSSQQNTPEERSEPACYVALACDDGIITRFSSLFRLQSVISYCFRFCNNCRKPKSERETGPLSLSELQNSLNKCIQVAQFFTFSTEVQQLAAQQTVCTNSRLQSLHPFLDDQGLLRVGGRLQRADLTYNEKHPLILPEGHHLTKLIVEHEHKRLLHAGCQLLLASLRQRYWILNGRNTIRRLIHNCLICYKLNAKAAKQLMGQLPRLRVESARPFLNCGIDYVGPFFIKPGSLRARTKVKCYVSLFICFATRAIHLEVVNDLSTEAFIAALKRFVSRRGRSQNIYSDNGTNFVGADRKLKELQDLLKCDQSCHEIQQFARNEGINWHFIPPRSPHFGGFWEAGVKSFKHHLRRVMGASVLTYEEFYTLTCQIEACLNSRPLIPLSSDPTDLQVLTPGHFLIGTALTALPQPDLGSVKLSLLTRWERLQQQLQQFWSRWSTEYLHHLQQRSKWTRKTENIKPGTLVVVKEDSLPPLCWKLAVVETVHPGDDGAVRVATIRTASGSFKRPIVKLCPLPEQTKE